MKRSFVITLLFALLAQVHAADKDVAAIRNFIASRAGLEPYTGDTKCATRYQLGVLQYWNELDARDQRIWLSEVKLDTARSEAIVTPSGHFMLHWDNTGFNAVPQADISGNGIPDYIDSAMVIFDQVWETEITYLGYPPPPGPDGNPVNLYHIYFSNLGYYGLTWFDKQLNIENKIKYTSFMEIENDFAGFYSPGLKGLKVTAAHEFHHAIQLGYNVRQADFFFYEMTSTWMEEYNYPEINDYRQYLDEFFMDFSNTPFDYYNQFTFFPYGNFLYVQMLSQLYGTDIVRLIWNDMLDHPSLEALRNVLSRPPYNSSWLRSLGEYGCWLYFTGDRYVPGSYFPEAAGYPEILITTADTYMFPDQVPQDASVSELASYYLRFIGARGADINLLVTAAAFGDGGYRLLSGSEATGLYSLGETFSADGIAADTLVLQLVNAQNLERVYGLDLSTSVTTEISLGPNPVRIANGDREVLFRNIPEDGQIFVFSAGGLQVAHIEENPSPTRVWDLKNKRGEPVASGIYIYIIKSATVEHTGKLAVIR